ncbi:MAG: M48 family metalloprotease [Ectothiorhodospiraceae bacterium]|nr:M48 family metalloprotease [Ectothiorhodospiraceae bacterium]
MKEAPKYILLSAVLLSFLAGCAVNPVTGQRELSLVGEDWELEVGETNYAPLRQMQGGDYVTDPELVAYVQEVGQRVAAEADRDLPYEFTVINSSVPNAWALPGGKMAINRGLLVEMESEAELAAVLGHEVVHAAARHSAAQQSRQMLISGAVMAGALAVGIATRDERYAGVALLGGLVGAQLISMRYSRDAEREADLYGMRYMHRAGYNPEAAVDLQETFVRLSEGRDPGFAEGLFSSHPPSQERVENNRRLLRELGTDGETGRERYQQMIGRLKELHPTYELHDQGRRDLAEGNASAALEKARQAIEEEPREALFHALEGDALASQSEFADAEAAYSRALERDSSWFYHHLRRGMVREELDKLGGARQDLSRSLELVPTADGHYYLGNVERKAGNRDQAVRHYRTAAESDSPAGRAARQALNDMGAR